MTPSQCLPSGQLKPEGSSIDGTVLWLGHLDNGVDCHILWETPCTQSTANYKAMHVEYVHMTSACIVDMSGDGRRLQRGTPRWRPATMWTTSSSRQSNKDGMGGHSAKLQIPLTEPVSCGVQQLLRHEIIDDRFLLVHECMVV